MELLSSLFVQKPLHILLVAAVFAGAWWITRSSTWGAARHPSALLIPAICWLIYAVWEWAVMHWTPEADVRVDLLILWPALGIVTVWFPLRALFKRKVCGKDI